MADWGLVMRGTNGDQNSEQKEKERYVLAGGTIHLYRAKAPFTKSGKSILGALEYDPDEDKIRCHECGEWHGGLNMHLRMKHGINAREYKDEHGLKRGTALIAERQRQRLIIAGLARKKEGMIEKMQSAMGLGARRIAILRKASSIHGNRKEEYRNQNGNCNLQLLKKIKKLSEQVGRTPTIPQLREIGICPGTLKHRFGSAAAAIKLAGLVPNGKGDCRRYSTPQLIEMLSSFRGLHGRWPAASDTRRGLLPDVSTYIERFGSWARALRKADCPVLGPQRKNYSRRILSEMLSVTTRTLGRPPKECELSSLRLPASLTFKRYFGSFRAAVRHADVRYG